MSWRPSPRSTALHEAYHCAAQLCLGLSPCGVRVDWPTAETLGSTDVNWGSGGVDRDSARAVLISTLAGPLGDNTPGWPPGWPIDPAAVAPSARHDAEVAKTLAEYLKVDSVDWSRVCYQLGRLVRDQRFRRIVIAIADELERIEVLDAADIKRIADPHLQRHREEEAP